MTREYEHVCTYVRFADVETGREHIVRRFTYGSDHADAARQAFASLETSAVRILGIETFDGPPRNWKPQFDVEELPQ